MMKKILPKFFLVVLAAVPLALSAQMSDLIFSEYGEGTDNNKYLELYNGTGADLDLSNYVLWKIINEGDWYERAYHLEGILPHGHTFTVVNYKADSLLAIRRDTVGPVIDVGGSDFTFMVANGNEAFAIAKILAPGDTAIIDVIGEESGDVVPGNWQVAGVADAGAEHTWVRKKTVSGPNANWASSAGTSAEDSEWIVYPANYWKNVGWHGEINSAPATDLFISEICEGTDNNKALEIYNGTWEDVDLSNYVLWKIINEGNWYERAYHLEGILPHGKAFTVVNYKADSAMAIRRDTVGPVIDVGGSDFTFMVTNGNEAFALAKILAPGDTAIIDVFGEESGDVAPDNWTVAGVAGAGAEHTLVRKSSVCGPNADWASSAGTNEEDSEWVIYPQNYWKNLRKHSMYCGSLTQYSDVSFAVDMNQQAVAAEGVHIAGSFQGWDPAATPMEDPDTDGIWTVTLSLEQNQVYEYKFVNGNVWGTDESVPPECAQNNNRYVEVVESDIQLDTVCFASCGPCSGVFNVTFRVDMSQQTEAAEGVHIAGSFQGWDPSATLMDDSDGDHVWEITLELGGNSSYQYKFVNGNAWGFDESVPAECARDNNRYIDVVTSDVVTEAFCFGECGPCIPGGFTDPEMDRLFSVYPNPSDGQFEVSCFMPDQDTYRVRLYSAIGQMVQDREVVFHAGENSMMFNVDQKGVFFIEITGDHGKVYRKILVR